MFIKDLFTEFEFDNFTNLDDVSDSVKLDYIKEMIAFAKSDKQAVFMYFGFALASIAFLIDKLDVSINNAGYYYAVFFYIGITLLTASAVFFFTYWRKIHRSHMQIVSCIPKLNIVKTREIWLLLWKNNHRYFKIGLFFLSLGVCILITVLLASKCDLLLSGYA